MRLTLSIAIVVVILVAIVLSTRWRNVVCTGPMPTSLLTFIAILFTSGLDAGLIMFPLVDFAVYSNEPEYAFTNPLAIEFGFWGFLVWGFYFVTTFYFCIVEPRLRLFEIPLVKFVNNVVIIGTCAFTAFLFLVYLPDYITGISEPIRYGLVGLVILLAAVSSTDIRYVKVLSVSSTWLFFALIAGVWFASDMGFSGFLDSVSGVSGYFRNLHQFVLPLTDYHQFYLFWWFSWSIMIGQFVARFVSGLKTWHLLVALLVVPSIPVAIWFAVLYHYYANTITIPPFWNGAMIAVAIVFVINSLDSLIRLYTQNLGLTVERFGRSAYVTANWAALAALVLLYQLTPLKIEWVGLVVIAIYLAIIALLVQRRDQLINARSVSSMPGT